MSNLEIQSPKQHDNFVIHLIIVQSVFFANLSNDTDGSLNVSRGLFCNLSFTNYVVTGARFLRCGDFIHKTLSLLSKVYVLWFCVFIRV